MPPMDVIETVAPWRRVLEEVTPPAQLRAVAGSHGLRRQSDAAGFDAARIKPVAPGALYDSLP